MRSRRTALSGFAKPENLFLLFAIPFGIMFALLLPPLTGSDEYFHYHRIAAIAFGYWQNSVVAMVPEGIVTFLKKTTEFLASDSLLPYDMARYHEMAAIPLGAEHTAMLNPNHLTIHSPANYLPQIIMFRIAAAFGASPLYLLYITRITAVLASSLITYHAIRTIPSWKYALCALAMLPPLAFYRSCLSSDAITDALGMYFIACVMREICRTDLIKRAALIRLLVLGLLLGACKFPYIAATLLFWAIPHRRFASEKSRFLWACLIMMPGAIAGFAWMEFTRRSGLFTNLQYDTWGGHAYPEKQAEFISHDPFAFAGILAHTLFSLSFYVNSIKEAFGAYGSMTQDTYLFYGVMFSLFAFVVATDGTALRASYPLKVKLLVLPIFGGFLLLTLTALYIHWTGLREPLIKGFQGRYLYPFLPLFLLVIPLRGRPHAAATSALATGMFAFIGMGVTIPVLLQHWK